MKIETTNLINVLLDNSNDIFSEFYDIKESLVKEISEGNNVIFYPVKDILNLYSSNNSKFETFNNILNDNSSVKIMSIGFAKISGGVPYDGVFFNWSNDYPNKRYYIYYSGGETVVYKWKKETLDPDDNWFVPEKTDLGSSNNNENFFYDEQSDITYIILDIWESDDEPTTNQIQAFMEYPKDKYTEKSPILNAYYDSL